MQSGISSECRWVIDYDRLGWFYFSRIRNPLSGECGDWIFTKNPFIIQGKDCRT